MKFFEKIILRMLFHCGILEFRTRKNIITLGQNTEVVFDGRVIERIDWDELEILKIK